MNQTFDNDIQSLYNSLIEKFNQDFTLLTNDFKDPLEKIYEQAFKSLQNKFSDYLRTLEKSIKKTYSIDMTYDYDKNKVEFKEIDGEKIDEVFNLPKIGEDLKMTVEKQNISYFIKNFFANSKVEFKKFDGKEINKSFDLPNIKNIHDNKIKTETLCVDLANHIKTKITEFGSNFPQNLSSKCENLKDMLKAEQNMHKTDEIRKSLSDVINTIKTLKILISEDYNNFPLSLKDNSLTLINFDCKDTLTALLESSGQINKWKILSKKNEEFKSKYDEYEENQIQCKEFFKKISSKMPLYFKALV